MCRAISGTHADRTVWVHSSLTGRPVLSLGALALGQLPAAGEFRPMACPARDGRLGPHWAWPQKAWPVGATPESRLPAHLEVLLGSRGEVRGDSPQPRQDVQQLQSWEGTGGHRHMGCLPLRPVPGLTPTTHSTELVRQEGNLLPRVAGATGLWEAHPGHTWCPGNSHAAASRARPTSAGPPASLHAAA